jgi:hypothetical protein
MLFNARFMAALLAAAIKDDSPSRHDLSFDQMRRWRPSSIERARILYGSLPWWRIAESEAHRETIVNRKISGSCTLAVHAPPASGFASDAIELCNNKST